jgi:acyl carrier protein
MTQEEIGNRVSAFIKRNYLFDEGKALDPAASLLGTGIVDSTGILELITFVEEDFQVSFTDNELTADNFDSVDKIVAILGRKLRNGTS